MFRVNEVICKDGTLYRILAILSSDTVWIALNDDAAFPSLVANSELITAVECEVLTRSTDPYENLAFLLPEEGTKARDKRERNYELIKPLIYDPLFFEPKVRSSIINQIIKDTGTTKQTLYRLIRRYWQRGQTPNALIPDFMNSGAKGEKRAAQEQKLGRPRKYTLGVGAIVDEHIEKLFRRVIDKYLLSEKTAFFSLCAPKIQNAI